MTNKIIEAWNAQADHMNQWGSLGEDEKLAWAYKQGLKDAAKVCDALKDKALASQDRKHLDDLTNTQIRMVAHLGHGNCADAIRALKEQQHG